jgi:hypothetical protein
MAIIERNVPSNKVDNILRVSVMVYMMLCMGFGSALAQKPSQAQTNAIRQSCRADYQSYCSSVPTGGQAALSCLQQNAASLSPSCHKAVAAVGTGAAAPSPYATQPPPPAASPRQEAAILRQACRMDYRAHCSGVQPGDGRALACLRENGPSLSRGCQSALISLKQQR